MRRLVDRYTYDRGDYSLPCILLESDWDNILEDCSLDDMWCLIQNRIKDAMDIAIPKSVSHTSSRPRPMWMDADTFSKVGGKHSLLGPGIGISKRVQGLEKTFVERLLY